MIAWIILGLIIAAAIYTMNIYNTLVRLKNMTQEAWSGIDVQLKRRYDLIPNLVETVKGYAAHETELFEKVTLARTKAINAHGVEGKAAADASLGGALKTLFAVAESYPELKANTNFLELQKTLAHIETDIQLARRYYNGATRDFNMTTQMFPSSIVARMAGFSALPFFEVDSEERDNPEVKF